MYKIDKRLEPKEGIPLKLGDKVVYEIIWDDGQLGTLTTFISEFDLQFMDPQNTGNIFFEPDKKEK